MQGGLWASCGRSVGGRVCVVCVREGGEASHGASAQPSTRAKRNRREHPVRFALCSLMTSQSRYVVSQTCIRRKNREERGDVRAFGFSSIFRPPRRPVALTPASYLYVKYKYTSTVSK